MVFQSKEFNIGREKNMIGKTILIKLLSHTSKLQQLLMLQRRMIIRTSITFIYCRNIQKRNEQVEKMLTKIINIY